MAKETNIEVPLPEYVRQIAREAGRAAAAEVLGEHQGRCPVQQLAVEVWGQAPDRDGLKQHVAALMASRSGLGWLLRYVLVPVLVALLTSAALVLVWGRNPAHASAGSGPAATHPVANRP
jgi:hypothetical protein